MATKTLRLYLPISAFEGLHELADKRGKVCHVKRTDLVALLLDHSVLLGAVTDHGVLLEDDFSNSAPVRTARK